MTLGDWINAGIVAWCVASVLRFASASNAARMGSDGKKKHNPSLHLMSSEIDHSDGTG